MLTVESFTAQLEEVRNGRLLHFFDLITVEAVDMQDLELLFDMTVLFRQLAHSHEKKLPLLRGKSIINVFFENSTRTRISFELGGKHLGADTINFSANSSSTSKGETIGDTARTLNSMHADLIICRSGHAGVPQLIINELDCPVINAGDGCHEHPSQALFDVFTMYEHFGRFEGVKLCIIGDVLHSRVAGSLMRLANQVGMDLSVCAPASFIPEGIEQFTQNVYYNLDDIIGEQDVFYTLRVQQERDAMTSIPSLREYSKCYGINAGRLAKMKKKAIVMHPGPVMREVDMASTVLDSPQCKVNDQVENGFALRMALMWLLVHGYYSHNPE